MYRGRLLPRACCAPADRLTSQRSRLRSAAAAPAPRRAHETPPSCRRLWLRLQLLVANGAAAAACRRRRRRRAKRARAGPLQAGHLRRRRPAELSQGGVVLRVRLRVPPRARAYVVHDDGCSDSAAIVTRTGVVAGRCALRTGYGGVQLGLVVAAPW